MAGLRFKLIFSTTRAPAFHIFSGVFLKCWYQTLRHQHHEGAFEMHIPGLQLLNQIPEGEVQESIFLISPQSSRRWQGLSLENDFYVTI